MNERINDKIIEIEKYLQELNEIMPANFEEYIDNLEKRLACERMFEKIMESVIDLGFVFANEKKFKMPEGDEAIFDVIYREKIIPEGLSQRLKDAKGMRNFIIHQYGKIDDELVFDAVTEQLGKDASDFIKYVKEGLNGA